MAATTSTTDAGASTPSNDKKVVNKPERPDQAAYEKELAEADKKLQAAVERQKAVKAKLDSRGNNKDSPAAKRRAELLQELNQIKEQQKSGKNSRSSVLSQIQRLDEQLKSRIAEQKTARGRVAFKSADDVQNEINRLQKQVDTGMMKLVDEKKALAEITALNKQKKGFAGFDAAQKTIDDLKAQIAELRKSLDDPASKALSDRFTAIQQELDTIKAEQDEVFKNLNALRDERTKANEAQAAAYTNLKEIKDKFYQARRAHKDYEQEAYRIRKERQQAERQAYESGKRKAVAQAKLEEASAPAYRDEILTTQGLIRYFDPSSTEAKQATGPSKFAAQATRTVDASGIKGTALPRKGADEEDYFVGGGGKKGKKGKKSQAQSGASPATPSESAKFNIPFGVLEELAKVDVQPPSNQGEVPGVVEKLKEKLEHWKKDQDRKTKENIAKAQKEIERLESEVDSSAETNTDRATEGSANKVAEKQQGVNGDASAGAELAQEKDGVADAAEDLEKAKIEDATAPES
ncbi:hypothetical protein AAFC00_001680 [Neodothiora populina]|uniref:Nuclear segregation protein n=1 Tax=Neodothiora populina TaxID=2781224 RepID=A0ABR3PPT3_9PEZI